MRALFRIVKRQTTDEEALEIKKAIAAALEKFKPIEVNMNTED